MASPHRASPTGSSGPVTGAVASRGLGRTDRPHRHGAEEGGRVPPARVAEAVLAAGVDVHLPELTDARERGEGLWAVGLRTDGATVRVELLAAMPGDPTVERGVGVPWWTVRELRAALAPAHDPARSARQIRAAVAARRTLRDGRRSVRDAVAGAGPPAALRGASPGLRGPGVTTPPVLGAADDLTALRLALARTPSVRLPRGALEALAVPPDPADRRALRTGWPHDPHATSPPGVARRPRGRRAPRGEPDVDRVDPLGGVRFVLAAARGPRDAALALVLADPVGDGSGAERAWVLDRRLVRVGATAAAERVRGRLQHRADVLAARVRCASADLDALRRLLREAGAPGDPPATTG